MISTGKNIRQVGLAVFDNDVPILEHTHTEEPVFLPGNMLESARIQKNLPPLVVPAGCLLDFDGFRLSGLQRHRPCWWRPDIATSVNDMRTYIEQAMAVGG